MNYKARFIEAVSKTREVGLQIDFLDTAPLPFTKSITKSKHRSLLILCAESLNSLGYKSSTELAGRCIPVHLFLQKILKKELKLNSYITIGDRYWNDKDIYCEMSYAEILKELKEPSTTPINAHVWLTLSDGSILDCTAEAHIDVLENRGVHPVDNCISFFRPGAELKSGYHRPYIVGKEFLLKTNSAPLEALN
jgi:hypothetical protein